MKTAAILVFLVEVFLSHQNGRESGAESKWLAERIHIKEGILRKSAHVLCFMILSILMSLAYGTAGYIAVAAWAAVDELTKPVLRNQRHCSGKEILLNLAGVVVGGVVLHLG